MRKCCAYTRDGHRRYIHTRDIVGSNGNTYRLSNGIEAESKINDAVNSYYPVASGFYQFNLHATVRKLQKVPSYKVTQIGKLNT